MKGIIYQYYLHGKYYVGKTYMIPRKRINKHKYEAFTLKADHPFHRAIRKYGWDATIAGYSVIEEIEAETKQELNRELIEREAHWIQERNSLVPNGYNVMKSGQIQIPHTLGKEEIYKKVSESLKGKYLNCPSTSKKVYCVDQDKWYPSVSEAERQNNMARGSVGKAASGINVKAGGMKWSFTGRENIREDKIKAKRKPIYCVETGEKYESIYDASKKIFGAESRKMKPRIQASVRDGWSVNGLHYKLVEQDNPVLSETEV